MRDTGGPCYSPKRNNNLPTPTTMELMKIRDFIFGMMLSVASWEAWQNIAISILIAFVGGFAAAAGRALYARVTNKKPSNE